MRAVIELFKYAAPLLLGLALGLLVLYPLWPGLVGWATVGLCLNVVSED